MRTLRYFFAPVMGALIGFLVNLVLIEALAHLEVRIGEAAGSKWTPRVEMLTEQVTIFLLCGLVAGTVAGRLAGVRRLAPALGMLAGLIAWLIHWGYAMWQGAAEQILQAPGVAAVIYGAALGAVLVGGYAGAWRTTRRRRRR
jgi:hypothetical protein